jgi:hypothetical protein
VGGIVTDLQGLNGNRVVAQISAADLFVGFNSVNPQDIGTQAGFNAATLAALGGGLTGASFRVTLADGDSAPGDFDDGDNTFLVDGINLGNFSSIGTIQTTSDGLTTLSTGTGFGDNILSTGFFSTTNVLTLAQLFAALSDGSLTFALADVDSGDNFLDFKQGVEGSLINVGSGPVINPPVNGAVPEPSTWAMMIVGFGAVGYSMRTARRRKIAIAAA